MAIFICSSITNVRDKKWQILKPISSRSPLCGNGWGESELSYKKAEGFFYYLCCKENSTREEIISVLWGADNENVGRKNLREAVYQIKKLLGKEILVTVGHTSISLNPECMQKLTGIISMMRICLMQRSRDFFLFHD